jgi:hypothetical protein
MCMVAVGKLIVMEVFYVTSRGRPSAASIAW